MAVGHAGGSLYLVLTCVRLPQQDVFPDGEAEQHGLLGDDADVPPQAANVQAPHVLAIDQHLVPEVIKLVRIQVFSHLNYSK